MSFFWEIHSGLPREGPGDNESTRRAFSLMSGVAELPRILDVGCGPGAQTIELAKISGGTITAVDTHQPFLDVLETRARQAGVADRISAINASMLSLPFAPASFDIIWSEGAMYILGFKEGLEQWRDLLTADGHLAVSEACWLKSGAPEELKTFWAEYPAMTTIDERLGLIARSGYRNLGHFVLPEASWWNEYYVPMEKRMKALAEQHGHDPEAQAEIASTRIEIDMYRRYADFYGYVFFVMRRT